MACGKKIELFLVDDSSDGIVTAELGNWNGLAIKIPRTDVVGCKREDMTGVGTYFLFGKNERDIDSVYIGESENILERLKQHIRDYEANKEMDYWTTAVCFLVETLTRLIFVF